MVLLRAPLRADSRKGMGTGGRLKALPSDDPPSKLPERVPVRTSDRGSSRLKLTVTKPGEICAIISARPDTNSTTKAPSLPSVSLRPIEGARLRPKGTSIFTRTRAKFEIRSQCSSSAATSAAANTSRSRRRFSRTSPRLRHQRTRCLLNQPFFEERSIAPPANADAFLEH